MQTHAFPELNSSDNYRPRRLASQEDSAIDSNFLKLFKMSQVIVKHLLGEYTRLKQMENEMKGYESVSQENRKLRKLLQIHQSAFSYNVNGNCSDEVQCPHCPKAFYDVSFLQSHLERRHSSFQSDAFVSLSLTQRINDYQSLYARYKDSDVLIEELNTVKQKLEAATNDLEAERNARLQLELDMEAKVRQVEEAFKVQSGLIFAGDSDDGRDASDGEERRSERLSPLPGGTNIERIMLYHTQEVQKLGNNIQVLANKIAETYAKSPHIVLDRASLTVQPAKNFMKDVRGEAAKSERRVKNKLENAAEASRLESAADQHDEQPIAMAVDGDGDDDEDDEDLTAEEINNYVSDVMTMLGVPKQATGISNELYAKASKTFKSTFFESDQTIKRNINQLVTEEAKKQAKSSKQPLSLKVKRRSEIEERIAKHEPPDRPDQALTAQHEQQLGTTNTHEEEQSKWSQTKSKPTPAARDDASQPVDVQQAPEKKSDQPQSNEDAQQKAAAAANPLKSVLKKKEAPAAAASNTATKGRRISFSETRVEISPEQSEMSDFEEVDLSSSKTPRKPSIVRQEHVAGAPPTPKPRTQVQPGKRATLAEPEPDIV